MTSYVNFVGRKFGRLTVVARTDEGPRWLCKCDCGEERTVATGDLTSGNTKSCGCFKRATTRESLRVRARGRRKGGFSLDPMTIVFKNQP